MAFNRVFVNPYPFENLDKLELIKTVQQKEKEGWEMIKPIFSVERKNFHSDDGRIKWVAVMRYDEKSSR